MQLLRPDTTYRFAPCPMFAGHFVLLAWSIDTGDAVIGRHEPSIKGNTQGFMNDMKPQWDFSIMGPRPVVEITMLHLAELAYGKDYAKPFPFDDPAALAELSAAFRARSGAQAEAA